MPTPLLKTKLYIPAPSPNTVSRPRLCERLDQGLAGKLTLVAAPAGFGKTTLLSYWIQRCSQAFAWVSLDETDNDPSIFWVYVVKALQRACEGFDQVVLASFNPLQLPAVPTLVTSLINDLSANQQKIVLVLDDYHIISNTEIHKQIVFLINNLPSQLHIILSTRANPPLPLAQLRAKSQLSELRVDDLRFTLQEATTFLNKILELGLSSTDIGTLDERTEGWAAGLQLAALSMRGRADRQAFITAFSGSHHFVLEYLTEEVINQSSEAQRHFLLQTSILDSFCAPLCNQVLGIIDSASQLSEIQRSNLFLVSLDDERIWFRYHHLFADLLKNRLRQDFGSDEIMELYHRAGQWYQEQTNLDQAIKYYLLAQNFEQAAALIVQVASSTMLHGQLKTILNWIEALPENFLEIRPRLRFYQAWALSLGGQHKVAEKILVDTKSSLEDLPDSAENQNLRGELAALLTGIITYYNDPPRIIREAQEALTYLTKDSLIPRARVHIALGTAYAYSGEMGRAIQKYQRARDLALKAKNPFLATAAVELLAGMQIYHLGLLKDAHQNLEQVLDLGRAKNGTYQAFTGTAHVLLAAIYLEWDNLDAAKKFLGKSFELLQQGGIGYSLTHAYCTQARLHLAERKPDDAVESLRLASQAAQDSPLLHILIHNLACQTKLALSLGDVEKAARLAEDDSKFSETLPTYLHEVQQISAAWVSLVQGNLDKSIDTLNHIYAQAEAAGRMAHVIEIYLVKALTYQKQGELSKAIQSLKRSISLAASEGYTRIFLERGKPVWKLLSLIADQNFNHHFVSNLLAAFDAETADPRLLRKANLRPPIQDSLIEPLSERECEVLKLIAAGYTNQQIADTLVVSLNTIKKHTTHIYSKLGVKNRTEAANYAHELSLA